jgi:PHP family Zn ribbon phosphoesterase
MSGAFDLTPMLTNSTSTSRSPERLTRKFTRFSTEATPERVVPRLKETLDKMPVIYKLLEDAKVTESKGNYLQSRYKYLVQCQMD